MRLFTAIDLSEEVRMRLERLISSLRQEALLKWSPFNNLHVTTKFIGEWPEYRLHEVRDALTGIADRPAFSVDVKGFGWFPNERSPRVLWCGVEGAEQLQTLAQDIEAALLPVGIAREERAYTPHLTLARISHPVPLERLRERVAELRDAEVGSLLVTGVHLYQSQPGSNASQYRKLQSYGFHSVAAAGKA
jgi:2'-5' RNA ligase